MREGTHTILAIIDGQEVRVTVEVVKLLAWASRRVEGGRRRVDVSQLVDGRLLLQRQRTAADGRPERAAWIVADLADLLGLLDTTPEEVEVGAHLRKTHSGSCI